MAKPDDTQLLRRTAKGHQADASELWLRFAPGLTRYARTLVPSEPDAEDVVQNVFCAILRMSPAQAAKVQDVRAYLTASVRRAALNQLRGMRRRRRRHERFGEQRREALERLAGLNARRNEEPVELERIDAAVASLPRRDQELIVLKHVAEMTFDQIALALATNRNTIAARYRRAVARLSITLGEPAEVFDPPDTSHRTNLGTNHTGELDPDLATLATITATTTSTPTHSAPASTAKKPTRGFNP